MKHKTHKAIKKECLSIGLKFNPYKNTHQTYKLQQITLPGLSLTLHISHIAFTKRTFYIYSYYIFIYINLINKQLHKYVSYRKENSIS